HNPILGANIILLNSKSNSVQDGTITNEEGEFHFSDLKRGEYKIEISYLGFETFQKHIELEKNYDLGTIILKANNNLLGEVVIQAEAKKPIIEMRMDRTIFNISQSNASIGGNAVDALRVTPGIQIKNSAINLVGKGSVKLMIDGQMIRLSGQSAFN